MEDLRYLSFLDEAVEGMSVSVPRADDESFNAFFSRTSSSEPSQHADDEALVLDDADFDHISVTASQL